MEKKNPAEGGASKPGLGHAGAGGRRYVTAVGRGGLESGAGTQPIDFWWFCLGRRRGCAEGQFRSSLARKRCHSGRFRCQREHKPARRKREEETA